MTCLGAGLGPAVGSWTVSAVCMHTNRHRLYVWRLEEDDILPASKWIQMRNVLKPDTYSTHPRFKFDRGPSSNYPEERSVLVTNSEGFRYTVRLARLLGPSSSGYGKQSVKSPGA